MTKSSHPPTVPHFFLLLRSPCGKKNFFKKNFFSKNYFLLFASNQKSETADRWVLKKKTLLSARIFDLTQRKKNFGGKKFFFPWSDKKIFWSGASLQFKRDLAILKRGLAKIVFLSLQNFFVFASESKSEPTDRWVWQFETFLSAQIFELMREKKFFEATKKIFSEASLHFKRALA